MMDDTTVKILSAFILFAATLIVSAIPVQLFEHFSKRSKIKQKHYHNSDNLKRYEYEDHSEHDIFHKLTKNITKENVVQFLTQLGGGVLLYTALIHMLPEIRENYQSYLDNSTNDNSTNNYAKNVRKFFTAKHDTDDGDNHLPLVDLCALGGFFGIFLIEELMHTFLLKNQDHHHHHPQQKQQQSHDESMMRENFKHHNGSTSCTGGVGKQRSSVSLTHSRYMQARHYREHIDSESDISVIESTTNENSNGEFRRSSPSYHHNSNVVVTVSDGMLTERDPITLCKSPPPCYESCETAAATVATEKTVDSSPITNKCNVENISNFELFITEQKSTCARIFDALLMILAFSCHAIFDGISIGVQRNNKIWSVLIAILSHKLLIAFVLSMQIFERCKQDENCRFILWIFSTIFAIMSPIGIFIVILMNETSSAPEENQLHIVILASISAGTIIYIVFLEIIDKSSSRTHITGFIQWIALLIGFALMHLVSVSFHED